MRRRRHARVPPDLTSLFDVLFIVIFAALIRAAAVQAAAQPKAAVPAPPVQLARAALRTRALAELDAQIAARPDVVVRVSTEGSISALEQEGKRIAVDAPLLEHSPDPDVALAYLGDRAAELRVCRLVALHIGVADLAHYLVIVAPERHLVDLPHALYEGLRRDIERCSVEQRGLAVLVDPTSAPPLTP
jgi:hypothetical protein